ncbi:MAG: hypothetical protein Q9220_003388 [cf. Caloplaca sp. 1 TL-2023]
MSSSSPEGRNMWIGRVASRLSVYPGSPPPSPTWPTVGDVQKALHPLQAEADRLGKQVEQFAETLDRLSSKNQAKPQADCTQEIILVDRYRKTASNTVAYINKILAPEDLERSTNVSGAKARSSTAGPEPTKEISRDGALPISVRDLENWQQEEQTWHLLGLMLQIQYPSSSSATRGTSFEKHLVRPSQNIEVHRYSSEQERYSQFLARDNQAWKQHVVVDWLKTCAVDSGQDIETVIRDLETDADRGSGLWAHSWLYTKEAIKAQKRLRSWPQALAPDSPGIDASLRNSNKTSSLVTQLDPDAVTRQGQGLEIQDNNFERATWLACWEMVRRGKDWNFIRTWCQERVENWRAISMRGEVRYHDHKSSPAHHPDPSADSPSRALWRQSCAVAARSGVMHEHEAAVYGFLSGYLPPVLKVCHSWNDYLFAHYSCSLISSFDKHMAAQASHQGQSSLQEWGEPFNAGSREGVRAQIGSQLIDRMRGLSHLAGEANDPFKLLQGSLIGGTFQNFVRKHGFHLARAYKTDSAKIKHPGHVKEAEPPEGKPLLIKPDDFQLLRIITHISLIYQDLGLSDDQRGYLHGSGIFIEAYTNYLSKAGKQQLLPLYASRLSSQKAIGCLARHLPLITDHGERQTMMRLMKQYGIDVPGVLTKQLRTIIEDGELNGTGGEDSPLYPALSMLNTRAHRKQGELPSVKESFMGSTMSGDQEDLINGFEWYLLLDGYWEQTLATGAVIYKAFLSTARSLGLLLQILR